MSYGNYTGYGPTNTYQGKRGGFSGPGGGGHSNGAPNRALEYAHAPDVVKQLGLCCEICNAPMGMVAERAETKKLRTPVTIVGCFTRDCPNSRKNWREGWAYHIPTRSFRRIFPA